jgi:hypothetical protein
MSDFREQATEIVKKADHAQVEQWAIDYWEMRLRNEERARAREVESAAQRAASSVRSDLPEGWSGRGSRVPLRSFGVEHDPRRQRKSEAATLSWKARKEERQSVAAEDVDLDTADPDTVKLKYASRVHALRIKVGSALHGGDPERWATLSPEERHLLVRAIPTHPSIDREGPEWLSYLNTPAGLLGRALVEASNDESMARSARRNAVLNKIRFDVAVEWTKAILVTEFALRDGTRVTWGDATAEQHRARVSMLHEGIAANAETAARHDAALQALADCGATCLNEVIEP